MLKFGKILTIAISSIALTASTAVTLVAALDDTNAVNLGTNEVRYYQGLFYSEGSLFYETPLLKRGDQIVLNGLPSRSSDADGTCWQFIGWDLNKDGVVDPLGDRIYFNFEAHAVYLKLNFSNFEITPEQIEMIINMLLDLNVEVTPEMIERIIEVLKGANIDWTSLDQSLLDKILNFLNMDLEEFARMLGLDLEDLLGFINAPVFQFTASDYTLPSFFRTQSFKDYKGDKWTNGDYYSVNNISEDSVNPLCFAADKLSKSINPTHYEITYFKKGKKFPVPSYELENTQNLNSESHSLEKPTPTPLEEYPEASSYSTDGIGFYPASGYTVPMALGYEFSNEAIKNDEIKYREFAYTNYLNVDKKYKDYFTQLAKSKDIVVDDTYRYIGQINEYFKDYSMFDLTNEEMVSYPEEEDKILYFMKEKSGLSENFAAATTLFYRSIGVPARYVQGYFSLPSAMGEPPIIVGGLFAHSWVEIYIDELGWMMVDTSIVNSLPDEYSEFLFGAPGVSINNFENRKLESIELSVTKDTYFVGSSFDKQDLTITAHYDNKTTAKIPVSLEYDTSNPNQSLVIAAQSFAYVGEKVVKVLYTEKGIPKTATLYINVVEPEIISFEPKEGTYQEKYILGATEPDINNIRFDGKLNDGSTTTFNKDGVIFEKDIDLTVLGTTEYKVFLRSNPEITSTVPITVLSEPSPDARLKSLENLNVNKPYQIRQNSENLDYLVLNIKATYSDGTYRIIRNFTNQCSFEDDFTELGRRTVKFSYTERNITMIINVLIEVVVKTDFIIFDVQTEKAYDGKPFDLDNLLLPSDTNHNQTAFLLDGEKIEIKVYRSPIAFDDFINIGSYTLFIKMRVVNEQGTILTDHYFEESNKINLRVSGSEEVEEFEIGLDGFEMDEEGYIDLDAFMFTIRQREITFTTTDIYEQDGIYYKAVTDELGEVTYKMLSSRLDSFIYSDDFAEGDVFYVTSLLFNDLRTGDLETENSVILDSIVIWNTERDCDVTYNYKFVTNWGKLYKLL